MRLILGSNYDKEKQRMKITDNLKYILLYILDTQRVELPSLCGKLTVCKKVWLYFAISFFKHYLDFYLVIFLAPCLLNRL